MNFGEALEQVRNGKGMRLPYWKEGAVVRAEFPGEGKKMIAPMLYTVGFHHNRIWYGEGFELFDKNWEVVE